MRLAQLGNIMREHGRLIRGIQWCVVVVYAFLVIVPACMDLPGEDAHLCSNLTLFAQWMFWGVWWPFVLLSMVLMGRVWCGVFCPEGTLTEFASKYGRGGVIPRWIKWGGWPFVAFVLTTIYGQMVSVYAYPKAALLVLGGSTVAAIIIGFLYGREKRVWCKYLCPVNGVFQLLARLAPVAYKVDGAAWQASYGSWKKESVNCAPLLPLRHMEGAGDCHMCGRCSGYRGAITLAGRKMGQEVRQPGLRHHQPWDSLLLVFGLFGVAIGAFHWTVSPWFVECKQSVAEWGLAHGMDWLLLTTAPWWLLTDYPENNDVFSWLDGAMLIVYILITAMVIGTLVGGCHAIASRLLGKWSWARYHHLLQALIPLGGMGVFLGLSATTVSLLKAEYGLLPWVNDVRALLLVLSSLYSVWLGWTLVQSYQVTWWRRMGSGLSMLASVLVVDYAWYLMFWAW